MPPKKHMPRRTQKKPDASSKLGNITAARTFLVGACYLCVGLPGCRCGVVRLLRFGAEKISVGFGFLSEGGDPHLGHGPK